MLYLAASIKTLRTDCVHDRAEIGPYGPPVAKAAMLVAHPNKANILPKKPA